MSVLEILEIIDISFNDFSGQTSRGGLLVGIFHHGFGVEHEDRAWLVLYYFLSQKAQSGKVERSIITNTSQILIE